MTRFILGLFAWRTVLDTGVWRYSENTVTGRRRIVRCSRSGWQPHDVDWLRGRYDEIRFPELQTNS